MVVVTKVEPVKMVEDQQVEDHALISPAKLLRQSVSTPNESQSL